MHRLRMRLLLVCMSYLCRSRWKSIGNLWGAHSRNCFGRISPPWLLCPNNSLASLEQIPSTCFECQSRTCHTESKPCSKSFGPDHLICNYQWLRNCPRKTVRLHSHQTWVSRRLRDLLGSEWVPFLGRTFFYIRKLQFFLALVVDQSLVGPQSSQSFLAHSVLCLSRSQHAKSCLGSKAYKFRVSTSVLHLANRF